MFRVVYRQFDHLTMLNGLARALKVGTSVILLDHPLPTYFLIEETSNLFSLLGYELNDSALSLFEMARRNGIVRGNV